MAVGYFAVVTKKSMLCATLQWQPWVLLAVCTLVMRMHTPVPHVGAFDITFMMRCRSAVAAASYVQKPAAGLNHPGTLVLMSLRGLHTATRLATSIQLDASGMHIVSGTFPLTRSYTKRC